MSTQLFGVADEFSPLAGTGSFLILIGCAVLLETLFHYIHEETHETPYQDMVSAIQKELMIVGFMAFAFKLLTNTSHVANEEWLLAVEFADTTIPITSCIYCFIGTVLVIRSAAHSRMWSRAYNLHLMELLCNFFEESDSMWKKILRKLTLEQSAQEVEFRILHNVFCETYTLQRHAIDFDEYCSRCYEKYLLGLVTISPISWFILCSLMLLNYARIKLGLEFADCSNHVKDSESYTRCKYESDLNLFVVAGFCLFGLTLTMAFLTRMYEVRLMNTRGVESLDDYATFLELLENKDNEGEGQKLSVTELAEALIVSKHSLDVERIDRDNRRYKVITDYKRLAFATFMRIPVNRSIYRLFTGFDFEDVYDPETGAPASHKMVEFNVSGLDRKVRSGAVAPVVSPDTEKIAPPSQSPKSPPSFSSNKSVKQRRKVVFMGGSERKLVNLTHSLKQSKSFMHSGAISEDFRSIFAFSAPQPFFLVIDSLIMIIAFQIALWVTQYSTIAIYVDHTLYWQILTIIPGIGSSVIFAMMIKTAALLHTIVFIDRDVIDETIEKTHSSKETAAQLREKLVAQLDSSSDITPEAQLKNLFTQIDEDNSKFLTRQELQHFLQGLRVSFSRKKWKQIFHEIDRNFDNRIEFDELLLFAFPEHDALQEAERKRIQALGKNVARIARRKLVDDNHVSMEAIDRISSKNRLRPSFTQNLVEKLRKRSRTGSVVVVSADQNSKTQIADDSGGVVEGNRARAQSGGDAFYELYNKVGSASSVRSTKSPEFPSLGAVASTDPPVDMSSPGSNYLSSHDGVDSEMSLSRKSDFKNRASDEHPRPPSHKNRPRESSFSEDRHSRKSPQQETKEQFQRQRSTSHSNQGDDVGNISKQSSRAFKECHTEDNDEGALIEELAESEGDRIGATSNMPASSTRQHAVSFSSSSSGASMGTPMGSTKGGFVARHHAASFASSSPAASASPAESSKGNAQTVGNRSRAFTSSAAGSTATSIASPIVVANRKRVISSEDLIQDFDDAMDEDVLVGAGSAGKSVTSSKPLESNRVESPSALGGFRKSTRTPDGGVASIGSAAADNALATSSKGRSSRELSQSSTSAAPKAVAEVGDVQDFDDDLPSRHRGRTVSGQDAESDAVEEDY